MQFQSYPITTNAIREPRPAPQWATAQLADSLPNKPADKAQSRHISESDNITSAKAMVPLGDDERTSPSSFSVDLLPGDILNKRKNRKHQGHPVVRLCQENGRSRQEWATSVRRQALGCLANGFAWGGMGDSVRLCPERIKSRFVDPETAETGEQNIRSEEPDLPDDESQGAPTTPSPKYTDGVWRFSFRKLKMAGGIRKGQSREGGSRDFSRDRWVGGGGWGGKKTQRRVRG